MKNIGKKFLPEGAISLENIDKIHIYRLLEEGGAEDLIPVLNAYAQGKLLEEEGKIIEAQKLYKETLKRNPGNEWMKEAVHRVKYILN